MKIQAIIQFNDLERRLEEHQNGEGANHTRKRLSIELNYNTTSHRHPFRTTRACLFYQTDGVTPSHPVSRIYQELHSQFIPTNLLCTSEIVFHQMAFQGNNFFMDSVDNPVCTREE